MTAAVHLPDLDDRRALEVARLLCDLPEHRAEVERLALRVLEAHPVGPLAVDARHILARLDGPLGAPLPADPARDAWRALKGLDDGQLEEAFARVTQSPARLAARRADVERDLGEWIRALALALRATQRGGLQDLRRHLEGLDLLTATSTFREHFDMALRDQLEAVRVTRFELRFAETSDDVAAALDQWQVERARELLEALGEPPAGLAENPLLAPSRQLEVVDEQRRTVEDLRSRLAEVDAPTDWSRLRHGLELLAEAREWLARALPATARQGLEGASEAARARLQSFIEREAQGATSLNRVRELGRNLERLAPRFTAAGVPVDPTALAPAGAVLARKWQRQLRATKEPAALEVLAKELALDAALLPAALAEPARQWAVRVRGLFETWAAVRSGQPFEALPAEPVPTRLKSEHRQLTKVAAEVTEAYELLQGAAAGPRRARAVAERILALHPGHTEAARLAQAAERAELARELDARLAGIDGESFDLDAYCEIASCEAASSAHGVLVTRRESLAELARLLGGPAFATAEAAARWWIGFAEVVRSLPVPTVPVLQRRLDEEVSSRRSQWALALDRALAAEAPAATWRALARGLEEVAGEPRFDPARELERYRIETLRRAELARVAELLDSRSFDRADAVLTAVEGDVERKRGLEVRLALERTRAGGDRAGLASALDDYWGRVVQIYGAEAIEMLLEALEGSWQSGQRDVLTTLRNVARRALRATEPAHQLAARLKDWLDWLELEGAVTSGIAVLRVTPLLDHLRQLDAGMRQARTVALVSAWRLHGHRPSLAWAFQALPELRSELFADGTDPVDGIADEIHTLVGDIEHWLTVPLLAVGDPAATLGAEALGFEQRGLRITRELAEIASLLDELPFPVTRFVPDPALQRALGCAASVLAILRYLAALEASDLRHEADRRLRCWVELVELPRAPWWGYLAERLERLDPLTRLTFDENRVGEAARLCGDPEALDTEGAFATLAAKLLVILDKLEKSGLADAPVAHAIAREYGETVPRWAGDSASAAGKRPRDLRELIARCESLERNERRIREAVRELTQREPAVGTSGLVDAGRHLDYLALVPSEEEAPQSLRAVALVERFLAFGERRRMFDSWARAGRLPAWLLELLQKGAQ